MRTVANAGTLPLKPQPGKSIDFCWRPHSSWGINSEDFHVAEIGYIATAKWF